MNTAHETTTAEIVRICRESNATLSVISKQTGIPYADLYDARHGRPMSIERENGVRRKLNLSPRPAAPMQRVTINPEVEAVRKLPGKAGRPMYVLRTWRGSQDDAARLDAILAAEGFSSLQDMVDRYAAENGAEPS